MPKKLDLRITDGRLSYPMKISINTRQCLFDLAKSILDNKNRSRGEWGWPFRLGKIPEDVRCTELEGGSLITSGEEYAHYRKCLTLLGTEALLKDISVQELDKELWHFFCEVFCDPNAFRNNSGIQNAVNGLLKRLNKPVIQYEVLIPLEKHLQLNGHIIELAGVKFIRMTEADVVGWGIDKDKSPVHERFCDAAIGNTVALMCEQCHGSDKAIENAREKLTAALNALRVALLIDHDPHLVGWRILDEQMLFNAGEELAIREKGGSTPVSIGFYAGFRSFQFIIDDVFSNQIAQSKQVIDCLFMPGVAQSRIQRRIFRALQWIGGSITRERLDDKIIDICTALETLLATKNDKKKGEAIVLRMMLLYSLLNKPFFDPVKLLEIYEKRSDIVHGSDRDICLDSDYKLGQWIAVDVLNNVLTYIRKHKITQHADFFKELETDPVLIEKMVDFWKRYPTHYKKIIKAAEEIIASEAKQSHLTPPPRLPRHCVPRNDNKHTKGEAVCKK